MAQVGFGSRGHPRRRRRVPPHHDLENVTGSVRTSSISNPSTKYIIYSTKSIVNIVLPSDNKAINSISCIVLVRLIYHLSSTKKNQIDLGRMTLIGGVNRAFPRIYHFGVGISDS